jgi:hypothetical protein
MPLQTHAAKLKFVVRDPLVKVNLERVARGGKKTQDLDPK